jgi:hypothetical protein
MALVPSQTCPTHRICPAPHWVPESWHGLVLRHIRLTIGFQRLGPCLGRTYLTPVRYIQPHRHVRPRSGKTIRHQSLSPLVPSNISDLIVLGQFQIYLQAYLTLVEFIRWPTTPTVKSYWGGGGIKASTSFLFWLFHDRCCPIIEQKGHHAHSLLPKWETRYVWETHMFFKILYSKEDSCM